jgi:branched-chain amino acid aminotransferase
MTLPTTSQTSMRTAEQPLLVYVNGRLVPEEEAVVSVFDSGLNFGDGVFEGLRVYAGRVFRLEQHVDRLFESANAFDIDIGMTRREFAQEIVDWLRANELEDSFHFRPIVTRGTRFPPRSDPKFVSGGPTIFFVGGPIDPAPLTGVRVIVSSLRRTAPDALDPRIKSLSFANNLLPRLEARRRGADDAVLLDAAGFVAEGSTANVFVVTGGELVTPWPRACLAGITRRAVIGLATEQGAGPVVERDITPTELINAQEVFFTGTGAEITPVVEVNGRPIGSGAAGPVTLELSERYAALVRSEGTPIGGGTRP